MKKDKYQVEAEYWRECYQSAKTSNTSIRAWMKENAPDVWRKYEDFLCNLTIANLHFCQLSWHPCP